MAKKQVIEGFFEGRTRRKVPVFESAYQWVKKEIFGSASVLREVLYSWKESNPKCALLAHQKVAKQQKKLTPKDRRNKRLLACYSGEVLVPGSASELEEGSEGSDSINSDEFAVDHSLSAF